MFCTTAAMLVHISWAVFWSPCPEASRFVEVELPGAVWVGACVCRASLGCFSEQRLCSRRENKKTKNCFRICTKMLFLDLDICSTSHWNANSELCSDQRRLQGWFFFFFERRLMQMLAVGGVQMPHLHIYLCSRKIFTLYRESLLFNFYSVLF